MYFDAGSPSYGLGTNWETRIHYVRAVCGGQIGAFVDSVIPGRMSDNGDGTVTDKGTGLMWQQEESGDMTWAEALTYCENLQLAGYDDWRLPNRNELQSIIDYQVYNPAVNTIAFPNVSSFGAYWSSSSYASNLDAAWYVDFISGDVEKDFKSNNYYARSVRGGR